GEMWSVVIESPHSTSTRAFAMSAMGSGSGCSPSKYGGFLMYVESASHANVSPVGVGSCCHDSGPLNTSPYRLRNMSERIDVRMAWSTSAWLGQISRRK